jgi:hypothetical protein
VELSSIIHVGEAVHQLHWSKGVAACPPPCGVMLIGASLSLLLLVGGILHHSLSLIEIFFKQFSKCHETYFFIKRREKTLFYTNDIQYFKLIRDFKMVYSSPLVSVN